MRLLTHNVLQCPRTQAYPLKLEVRELENVEVEYDKDFILRMLPRLDWGVLCQTARELNLGDLPESLPTEESSEQVLKHVHKVLLEVHVKEGDLVNPEGNRYKITDGIPNMMIADVVARPKEDGIVNGTEEPDDEGDERFKQVS